MTQISFMEHRANHKWNTTHPMDWPTPPRKIPHWFNIVGFIKLVEMEEVFGRINQSDLDRFWAEMRKGQSVYEDAGGYLVRCYAALMGLETEDHLTYAKATEILLDGGEI